MQSILYNRIFLSEFLSTADKKGDPMTETLSKAWSLFDAGNYTEAEALYKDCYAKTPSTDHGNYWQILMGLIYVESFLEHFEEARTYADRLIACAADPEEKHIAVHQAGMSERMAGDYDTAMNLFLQEETIINESFPDDPLVRSVNLYEQGYVAMKLCNLTLAEEKMQLALDFAEKSEDLTAIGCACRGLGEIKTASKGTADAASYFQKAIEVFQQAGDPYSVEEVQELLKNIGSVS